jgi:hypothetical protein
MAYIIFCKHPGDLIDIVNYQRKEVVLVIGNMNLRLISSVKMIRGGLFKVLFDAPSHKLYRNELLKRLAEMKQSNEVVEFSL